MATYYVATNGSTLNPGTFDNPWRWPSQAVPQMVAGDVLNIRAGTYNDRLDSTKITIPSGTSWLNAITIQAYQAEVAELHFTLGGGSGAILNFADSALQYLIVKNLILNGSTTNDVVSFNNGARWIRLDGCEIKNAPNGQGVVMGAGTLTSPWQTFYEILNCSIHDNGSTSLDHGLYVRTSNNLIKGCTVFNNASFGIQCFVSSGNSSNNNTIDSNTFHSNSQAAGVSSSGILLSSGNGNVAKNNFVYDEPYGITVHNNSPEDSLVYNNTVDDCTFAGLRANSLSIRSIFRNNHATNCAQGLLIDSGATDTTYGNLNTWNSTTAVSDSGTGTVNELGNITTTPSYLDAPNRDYRIPTGSNSKDAGQTLASVDVDFFGVTRPQGASYDIGAHEFEVPPANPPVNTVPASQIVTTEVSTAIPVTVSDTDSDVTSIQVTVGHGTVDATVSGAATIS